MAWCRGAGLQQDEEEDERKGSRKKGRSRKGGPYREHSADARYGGRAWAKPGLVWSLCFPKQNPKSFPFPSSL